jgi:2,2-dialkylglycine decarboxylase (pyruvate)
VPDQRQRFLIAYAGTFAPFTVARAEGAWVETTDGRRILDFTSGQICSTLGHNHPRIVEALRRALDEAIHLNSWMLPSPCSHSRSGSAVSSRNRSTASSS